MLVKAVQKTRSCVIVGAGMTGLSAAGFLKNLGWDVTLIDKGRSAGGRLATHRGAGAVFDYGAQFITVRDPRFEAAFGQWLKSGWARLWFHEGRHKRYCGTEGMKGLAAQLAQQFDCLTSTKVARIEPADKGWRIFTDAGAEMCTHSVVLTAPAPQSLALLGAGSAGLMPDGLLRAMQSISFDPCFAVLVSLAGPSRIPLPGFVRPQSGPIAFIGDNTQKGISPSETALTLHASPAFSRAWADTPREEVIAALLEAASPWFGSPVASAKAHFWKYSQPVGTRHQPCLFTAEPAPLAVAGDAFAGPRVEGAFLSGLAAARRIASA